MRLFYMQCQWRSDGGLYLLMQALVTKVFDSYIKLMRKVQTTYWCAI